MRNMNISLVIVGRCLHNNEARAGNTATPPHLANRSYSMTGDFEIRRRQRRN
ncbi:hypothetical protein J6590_063701 [Homalodisca vitripennis]|nr:hypothetical protein J6590_063701 [Homalodisca vitripennis]